MFAEWRGEYVGTFTKTNLKKYAADLNFDTAKFNQCLDTERVKPIVDKDIADARQLGINGTPTFIIGGRQLNIGPDDYPAFVRTLDALLR